MLALIAKRKTEVSAGVSLPVVVGLVGVAVFLVIGGLSSTIFAQQTVAGLESTPFEQLADVLADLIASLNATVPSGKDVPRFITRDRPR